MLSMTVAAVDMNSTQLASVMIVGSGAAHAIVNAVLKSGKDKMSSRALIDGFSALLMFPVAFFLPLPHGAWGWLAASAVVHLVYLICLIKSFESADMSVAYPIARGAAPALAAAGAVAFFDEPINVWIACGIGLVSSGVLLIGAGRNVNRSAIAWATATGVTIAVYTVVDAQGVRAAPTAQSYIAWIFLMPRRRNRRRLRAMARTAVHRSGPLGMARRPVRRRHVDRDVRARAVGLSARRHAAARRPARDLHRVCER